MDQLFSDLPLRPADILLPRNCDWQKWSVVACDQYTSEPDYWQRVERLVGDAPSTLRLILPEHKLEDARVEEHIQEINVTMRSYLAEELFEELPDALLYVERVLDSGKTRRGLIGMVDLEEYDYAPGSSALIRATEGTVLSRIPPRVAVRRNAALELPHVMLLLDDREQTVLEPLHVQKAGMECLYDFDLMERGGHISGYRLSVRQMEQVAAALHALSDPEGYREKYGLKEEQPVMLFVVGDGNHSLATAKACYEEKKKSLPEEEWQSLPCRYALVEVVNLYDESLEFEAIHRVCFDVEPNAVLAALLKEFPEGKLCGGGTAGAAFRYVYRQHEGAVLLPGLREQLAVGPLQQFLDRYLEEHGGRVDYIHGEEAARRLGSADNCMAFLLPAMEKKTLFSAVIRDGVLPRKTFSMGEAQDKRFYLEARRLTGRG